MSNIPIFRMWSKDYSLLINSWNGRYRLSVFKNGTKGVVINIQLWSEYLFVLREQAKKLLKADEGTSYIMAYSVRERETEEKKLVLRAYITLSKENTDYGRYHLSIKNVITGETAKFTFQGDSAFKLIEPIMSPQDLSELKLQEFIKLLSESSCYNAVTYEEYVKQESVEPIIPAAVAAPSTSMDDDIVF
jgi:hypothetical protein